jgi:pyridine nucleotide-disulfide oxidoreductase family protein
VLLMPATNAAGPSPKRLLLIGAGHAHAQVLRRFVEAPLAGVDIVIVSPSALAPYSGMVPGWLSGAYAFEEICIDFAALVRAAGARIVIDELQSLDPNRRVARLVSGTELSYDVLSLNAGSTLSPPAPAGTLVLSLRPLGKLRHAWETLLSQIDHVSHATTPFTVTAVGGGAAGVEALLGCLARLRTLQPERTFHARLLTRGRTILPGFPPRAVKAAQRALRAAGAEVVVDTELDGAASRSSDLILWATGAEAHVWQRSSGLSLSERGFIRVDANLRSVSHPEVYAVGDCAEWADPLPKAGVYSVRMGPTLTHNVRVSVGMQGSLLEYRPQRRILALLATGDYRAIAARGQWSASGRLVGRLLWHWKDHIDRKFLSHFVIENANSKDGLGQSAQRRAELKHAP